MTVSSMKLEISLSFVGSNGNRLGKHSAKCLWPYLINTSVLVFSAEEYISHCGWIWTFSLLSICIKCGIAPFWVGGRLGSSLQVNGRTAIIAVEAISFWVYWWMV